MHVIAAKAECFYEALQPEFKEYIKNVISNTKALADTLNSEGFRIVSGGTDNHLCLLDVKSGCGLTGLDAEAILDKINITVNKNTIPNDTEKPMITSGIRLGGAAMTSRGLNTDDFKCIGHIIAKALKNSENEELLNELKEEVLDLTSKYPLWY